MPEPTPTPAEYCGEQSPTFGLPGQPDGGTECVLRPGHTGSHADEHGMRWRIATPDPDQLREQVAEALREHWLCTIRDEADADGNLPCRCGDWREPGAEVDDENDWDSHLADAALAAVEPELQQLRAQLARVQELAAEYPVHIDTALLLAALDDQPAARDR